MGVSSIMGAYVRVPFMFPIRSNHRNKCLGRLISFFEAFAVGSAIIERGLNYRQSII